MCVARLQRTTSCKAYESVYIEVFCSVCADSGQLCQRRTAYSVDTSAGQASGTEAPLLLLLLLLKQQQQGVGVFQFEGRHELRPIGTEACRCRAAMAVC